MHFMTLDDYEKRKKEIPIDCDRFELNSMLQINQRVFIIEDNDIYCVKITDNNH